MTRLIYMSYSTHGKDPDAGKDWRQEEKGMTEDEMVGWHHRLNGHEFEKAPGDGDGRGRLAWCRPWGCKESDTTEWLNWTESTNRNLCVKVKFPDVGWLGHRVYAFSILIFIARLLSLGTFTIYTYNQQCINACLPQPTPQIQCEKKSENVSHLVVSNSLQPQDYCPPDSSVHGVL